MYLTEEEVWKEEETGNFEKEQNPVLLCKIFNVKIESLSFGKIGYPSHFHQNLSQHYISDILVKAKNWVEGLSCLG